MMTLILAWVQQHAPAPGFTFTGDEIRTAMIGVLVTICTYLAKEAREALTVLRAVLVDLRDLKRDVHGIDGKNGIKSDVKLLVQRVDAIEDRNIAIDAVVEAERQAWPHPDRRQGARRLQDVIREAQEERMRRLTDEHSTEDPDR